MNPSSLSFDTLILDLNGTLAVRGQVSEGVQSRLEKLKAMGMRIVLCSGDQRGNAKVMAQELGIELHVAGTNEGKERVILSLDSINIVAIGNARVDLGLFKHAKLSIATLQSEGIHAAILPHVDILAPSINDALDLLLDEDALSATMRV